MSESKVKLFVCNSDELEIEDVVQFKHNGKIYAVYRIEEGLFATDGLCTHEQACLADGLVMDDIIECPKHNARFHIPSGEARRKPAKINLNTYSVEEDNGAVFITINEIDL